MNIQITEDRLQQIIEQGDSRVPIRPLTSQKADGGQNVPLNFPLTFVRPDGTKGVIYPQGQEN